MGDQRGKGSKAAPDFSTSPVAGKPEAAIITKEDGKQMLLTHESGPHKGQLVVLIHGFPDDDSVWSKLVSRLSDEGYRCVTVVLPNYGGKVDREWGVSHRDMIILLKNTIDELSPSGVQVYLVAHDWGTHYAYAFERAYPQRVAKIVGVDVSPIAFGPNVTNPSRFGDFLKPAYMGYFAFLFLMLQVPFVPRIVKLLWVKMMMIPLLVLFGIIDMVYHPKGKKNSGPSRRTPPSPYQGYPYYYTARAAVIACFSGLKNGFRKVKKSDISSSSKGGGGKDKTGGTIIDTATSAAARLKTAASSGLTPPTLPKCAFCYVWGGQGIKKVMMYHGKDLLRWVKDEAPPGSQALEFPDAGHWVMKDEPTKFNDVVVDFFKQKK